MAGAQKITGDIPVLLADASRAVDSFAPGHWQLMLDLERRAPEIVIHRDIEVAADFLSNVVYLKRPHTTDRASVKRAVLSRPTELLNAIVALSRVADLGYGAMDALAQVPFFGRGGGRSFNSAVLRLVCPASFGIIDWRNVAVLCGSFGFEGLVQPPFIFRQFSPKEVLSLRGHLPFTMDVYREYNDVLRSLAAEHKIRAADIDLALWAFSIQRQPFEQFSLPVLTSVVRVSQKDREALRRDHASISERLVSAYLSRLSEAGVLSKDQVLSELRSVLTLIRNECTAFGAGKKGKLKEKILLIKRALEDAIASENPHRLMSQWSQWQAMVDPTSPQWKGISLPAEMILEGYLVLEDFIPVKEFIEVNYDSSSLEPRHACD